MTEGQQDPANPPRASARADSFRLSLRKKILFTVFVSFLLLLIGELLLRGLWHNSYACQASDHVVRLRLQDAQRNYHVNRSLIDPVASQVLLRTDQRSYILPGKRHHRPDATLVFLGGSTTECGVVQEQLRFPALVADLLEEHELKINSLNAAMSGATVHDSINVLFNHALQDRPDLVVLMHAANDIGVIKAKGGYEIRGSQPVEWKDIARWLKAKVSTHFYLAAFTRKAMAGPVALGNHRSQVWRNDPADADSIPSDGYQKRLRLFVALCRLFDIEPVLMTQPLCGARNELTPDWANLGAQDRFNAIVRQVGEELDVTVIDLVQLMNERHPGWSESFQYLYDGMHVNDQGSQIYASLISEHLLPLLEKRRELAARAE